MRRIVLLLPLLGPVCALILLLVCFRAVLFGGEQFAYRDSAHFYYPLYLRVQQEWNAGRWPLWDPWQNAGMPLLGMPMTAVFYPGKVLFAILSYPWATRLYAVAHVTIAWAGMFALSRGWGQSATAAGLAAMAYAFGAPVLFQYCNVIFLVGAAWVPWGFLALDRLLRLKRRSGLLGLAVVLALQVLGGDPEAAYLTVLCGGGYALVLAARGSAWPARVFRVLRKPWLVLLAVLVWVAAVGVAAYAVSRVSAPSWLPRQRVVLAVVWGGIGLWVLGRWWRHARDASLGPMLAWLAGGCALAVVLAAVQLVPALEFSGRSHRAADEVTMDIFYFSVEPFRLAEAVWPSVFGITGAENRSYFQALPQWGNHALWTPSLYLGGLTLALALAAVGMRDGPPWRAWLLAIALLGVVASFGRFAGPLWWLRWLRVVTGMLGPHDPRGFELRSDGLLVDGSGQPVRAAGKRAAARLRAVPLSRQSCCSRSSRWRCRAWPGLGWDLPGRRPDPAAWRGGAAWGIAATLGSSRLFTTAARPWIMAVLAGRLIPDSAIHGPIDLPAALNGTTRALVHGGITLALRSSGLGCGWAPRHPRRWRVHWPWS